MKRIILSLALGTFIACASGLAFNKKHPHGLVLYAQSIPYVATVTWTPDPATQNVVQYQTTLDASSPVTTPAASCTPTLCSQAVSIPTFGAHTVSVVAQNLKISTDPTSLQSSTATTLSFTLNQAPAAVTGVGAK